MNQHDQHHHSAPSGRPYDGIPVPDAGASRIVPRGSRSFLALWIASGASYFGYWAMQVALAILATHLTRSPLLVSGIAFALTVPALGFGLVAGVLVDRYDRWQILLSATILRLLAFGLPLLAAVFGSVTLPLLYGTAFVLGMTQTVEESAFAAAVPMIVPEAQLERANTWLTGAQNLIELLALPLGGLFASISVALALSVGEGSALAAGIALLLLRGAFRPPRPIKRHLLAELQEGVRFLWHQPVLRTIALMAGVINACWGAYLAVLVLYALAPGPVGLSAPGYGLLVMSGSVGGVLGTLLALPIQRWLGRRSSVGLNILGNAVMFAAPALSTNAWVIGGAAVLGGLAGPLWTIAAASLLGHRVPHRLQGRVNAAYRFLGNGLAAVGPLPGGMMAQLFGFRAAFALCTGLTLLMLLPFFQVVTEQAMQP
jgi:MFS family permease